jgi:predicted nucleic acid-binding protein
MTIAELRTGAMTANRGTHRRFLLDQFVRGFQVSHADDGFCTIWARIRADARVSGRAISSQDTWIAATVLALHVPPATNNRRDYPQVRGLRLLSSEAQVRLAAPKRPSPFGIY